MNHFQSENRDADVDVDTGGESEGGTNWENQVDIYTLPCIK